MPKTMNTTQYESIAIELSDEVKGKLRTSFQGESDEVRLLVEHKAKKQEKDFTDVYAEILFTQIVESRYQTRLEKFNTVFINAARIQAALKGTDAAVAYLMDVTELNEAQALAAITKK